MGKEYEELKTYLFEKTLEIEENIDDCDKRNDKRSNYRKELNHTFEYLMDIIDHADLHQEYKEFKDTEYYDIYDRNDRWDV